MAITQNPIVGRTKQKFGNAVFSKWKDKNTLRAKPLSVANPRSPLQRLNRNKITALAYMSRALRPIIQLGFKGVATSNTQYNQFASRNYAATVDTTENEVWSISGQLLRLSSGSLPQSPYETALFATNQIQFTRPAGALPSGLLPTDKIAFAVVPEAPMFMSTGEEYAEDIEIELTFISCDQASVTYTSQKTNLSGYRVIQFVWREGTALVSNQTSEAF